MTVLTEEAENFIVGKLDMLSRKLYITLFKIINLLNENYFEFECRL